MLASPGRPCGFPERALMRGIITSRGARWLSRTLQIELRALLDKILSWGAIFQVAVAERRKDGARRRAGQASDESSTIFLAMDDWAARGAMKALIPYHTTPHHTTSHHTIPHHIILHHTTTPHHTTPHHTPPHHTTLHHTTPHHTISHHITPHHSWLRDTR